MTFSMLCLVRQIDAVRCLACRPAYSHTGRGPHAVATLAVYTDDALFEDLGIFYRVTVCYSSGSDRWREVYEVQLSKFTY
jgi:hypothetical protein